MAKYKVIKDYSRFKKDSTIDGIAEISQGGQISVQFLQPDGSKAIIPLSFLEKQEGSATVNDKKGTNIIDVPIPFMVKALPYIGVLGGGLLAHHRKSKVGGWIGWILLGWFTGVVIAIPFAGKAMFKGLIGAGIDDMKKQAGDNSGSSSGNSLTTAQKKDWITKNLAIYGFDDTAIPSISKLSDNELNLLYIMGNAPSKYGKNIMNPTPDNAKKIKDAYGVDVTTAQFKADAANMFAKLTA